MRTLSKDVKKKKKKEKKLDVKNKAITASNQRSNCPHGSLIIHQMFLRAVCKWLVVLRLNVPVNNFSVMSGRSHRFLGN